MSILHLCNVNFEWELAGELPENMSAALAENSIFQQLQFLPLSYADEGDGLLVTEKPKEPTPLPLYLPEDEIPYSTLSTWGYSQMAKAWADAKGIDYPMPDWSIVKMVNSKSFSFAQSPLPGARLLYQGDPIEEKTVLKSCFGTAGRGLILSESPKVPAFCEAEWAKGLPVLSEPWVNRHLDFSTQWVLSPSKEIEYIGATICRTSPTGIHQSNILGPPIPMLEEHKERALDLLKEMGAMGYFGHVGIDAMIYDENLLQPIVEINARKTMGWMALMVQQKHCHGAPIEVSYTKSEETGLLPQALGKTYFHRQLTWRTL